jgi:hypothetical protein
MSVSPTQIPWCDDDEEELDECFFYATIEGVV